MTSDATATLIFVLLILLVIFLAIRQFWTWYWKINHALTLLRGIRQDLQQTNSLLGSIQGTLAASAPAPAARPAAVAAGVRAPADGAPSQPYDSEPAAAITRDDLTSDNKGICPRCGTANPMRRSNCQQCGINLLWDV
jgi:ribosomal protein S27AE